MCCFIAFIIWNNSVSLAADVDSDGQKRIHSVRTADELTIQTMQLALAFSQLETIALDLHIANCIPKQCISAEV